VCSRSTFYIECTLSEKGFLFNGLRSLNTNLRSRGSYLVFPKGKPIEVLRDLLGESGAEVVYAEEDFTPYALQRDQLIANHLPIEYVQGQLIHHPQAFLKSDGAAYTV